MKEKKRKTNYKKAIIVFTIILFGILVFFYIRSLKVKTIYVVGNKLVSESEILESTNLLDYPKIYKVNEKDIINKLKENKLIIKIGMLFVWKLVIILTKFIIEEMT